MSAYVIFLIRGSHDHDALQRYRVAARPTIGAHGGRVLVARGAQTELEGGAPQETVVIEFDSREQALDWYRSGQYQEASKLRRLAAEVDAYVVEGIAPAR